MDRVLTNSQMRTADAYTINTLGISAQTLMHRAGTAIADEVESAAKKLYTKNILIVCGTGNNGGDGYVCAQALLNRGYAVKVYAFEGKLSADCAQVKQAYTGEYTAEIKGGIIVDCIFGTGLDRAVEGKYKEIITAINASGAYIISADIPSGLNGDNGLVLGCAIKANLTVAIAEYKAGHFLNDGLDFCGKLIKKDIGITCPEEKYIQLYADEDIKKFYPERKHNSHKGTYGSANIIAGCDKYIGAAALSISSALKSGCGYVKLTTSEKVKLSLAPAYPQVIYLDNEDLTANAIAIGMGCGVSQNLHAKIKRILKEFNGTLLIDADGLNTLSEYGSDILRDKSCKVILTPHVKEFLRLTGKGIDEILADPLSVAQSFAKQYGVTLLLKGAASIICDGENTALNIRGNSALSKGGSGDMLSGYICGLTARGLAPFDAAVCAAYTLGLSAEISAEEVTEYCATAEDIIKNLHFAVLRLTKED
ncbi:MAG: NAD(P)H-hydrate dehydratase [Clostridia bacterium]|nr:NAD(P)H-hydrate dehydratase [Clostridia bacterium]